MSVAVALISFVLSVLNSSHEQESAEKREHEKEAHPSGVERSGLDRIYSTDEK